MKKFLCIILCLFINTCIVSASSIDYINTKTALIETSMSYYRKKGNIQYDSFRKRLYATGEEASSQNIIYTVNSGFVYQVYYQTLGIKLPTSISSLSKYAKDNYNSRYNANKDYIVEYLSEGKVKDIYSSDYVKALSKKIEVGDILNIQKNNGLGEALIVKEVNKTDNEIILIGASGTMYNYSTHTDYIEDKGAIKIFNLKDILKNDIKELSWIRIIHDNCTYIDNNGNLSKYSLTESAKSRLDYKGIEIVKTSSKPNTTYVSENEDITYTIEIKNNSNFAYKGIKITEYISPYTTVVKHTGTFKDNKIVWKEDIGSNKSVKIEYTVRVNNNSLGRYILSKGYVANINNATIVNLVGTSLSNDEKDKIKSSYRKLVNSSKEIDADFISLVYKDALDIDISYLNNKDMYNLIRLKDNKIIFNNNLKSMIVGNYYGLRIDKQDSIDKQVISYNNAWDMYNKYEIIDRARTLDYNNLEVGDIIYAYTETNNNLISKVYLYLGDGILARKYDTKASVKYSNSGTIYSDNTTGTSKINNMLSNLVGDNFIVIRPSLARSNITTSNVVDVTKLYNDIGDLSLLDNNVLNDNNYDLNRVLKDNFINMKNNNYLNYILFALILLIPVIGVTIYILKYNK